MMRNIKNDLNNNRCLKHHDLNNNNIISTNNVTGQSLVGDIERFTFLSTKLSTLNTNISQEQCSTTKLSTASTTNLNPPQAGTSKSITVENNLKQTTKGANEFNLLSQTQTIAEKPWSMLAMNSVQQSANAMGMLPTQLSSSPSFTVRLGEKLSAVAERISNKLLLSSKASSSLSDKNFVETLYPEQCAEKNSLIPTFMDDSVCQPPPQTLPPFVAMNEAAAVAAAIETPPDDLERQCRICLLSSSPSGFKAQNYVAPPQKSHKRKIVAPCRCAGTVQYVHIACLTHWIEVSSRKMYSVPKCELCGFKFRRKPFIDLTRLHFPYVDWCDRILNLLFVFLVAIMVLCGWVAVHYFCLTERRPLIRPSRNTNTKRFLSDNDVTVIIASILFFAAFFIALFTQYRAEVTVFRIMARLWATNRNWRIRDYDPRLDDIVAKNDES